VSVKTGSFRVSSRALDYARPIEARQRQRGAQRVAQTAASAVDFLDRLSRATFFEGVLRVLFRSLLEIGQFVVLELVRWWVSSGTWARRVSRGDQVAKELKVSELSLIGLCMPSQAWRTRLQVDRGADLRLSP
jgi:hypothetical protein